MRASRLLIIAGLLVGAAGPASAQSVTLEFNDGRVKLVTQNAPVSLILAEWARRGKTTIVNGERVPGPPATLLLENVTEQEALDVVLRTASGYLTAVRETPAPAGASTIDRILILPTSRVTTTGTVLPPPQQQAFQAPIIDDDDGPPPPGAAPPPPGQRTVPPNLPPGVRLPQQEPNRLPQDEEARPAVPPPATNNPFGVQPGSATPGVITPVPNQRPAER